MQKKEVFSTLLNSLRRHFSVQPTGRVQSSNADVTYWPKPALATVFLKQDKVLLIQRGKNPNKGQWVCMVATFLSFFKPIGRHFLVVI